MPHPVVLVTGATGFLGRHLVLALAPTYEVRALTRDPDRAAGMLPQGVGLHSGDLSDRGSLDRACQGVDLVVHLAASVPEHGAAADASYERTNVAGAAAMAAAARAAGATAFIHGSSAGVYGDGGRPEPHREDGPVAARTRYERSKLEAETAVRAATAASQTALVVLRMAGLYGPGRSATLEFYREVQRRRFWLHGPARVIVHPTFVGDAVQAIAAVLDRVAAVAGTTLNIAGERALTYPALVDLTARLLAVRIVQVRAPRWAGQLMGGVGGVTARAIGLPSRATVARWRTPVVNRSLDITRARQALGYRPASLDTSMAETIAWYRDRHLL